MKNAILFLLINVLLISCTQNKLDPKDLSGATVYGKSDPLNEIQWLKELVKKQSDPDKPSFFSIVVYEYADKIVIENESPFHSSPYIHVFNCDGNAVLSNEEYEKLSIERRKIKVLLES